MTLLVWLYVLMAGSLAFACFVMIVQHRCIKKLRNANTDLVEAMLPPPGTVAELLRIGRELDRLKSLPVEG